jgi:putative endonuclease
MPPRQTAPRAAGVRTPKQRAGAGAERAAEQHLVDAGCLVLERNARYPEGELDLVVRERDLVVFVEVRLRTGARYGGAAASVDVFKQKRVARAAQRWLAQRFGERWPACRFDVVAIDAGGRIEWIRDAFAV